MAAPVYASDLTTILADMASTTGWAALGGGASGLVAPETDFFIQGSNCISKAGWSTGIKGMIYNNGSGITVASGDAVFMWIYFWAPNSLDTETGGGLMLDIGSAATAYKRWYVGGSDTLTYGGWLCAAVDPTIAADNTVGSPSATLQYFGGEADVPAAGPSKGQPLGIDVFRYGRTFTCTNGDTANGYATFSGAAVYNDEVSRRYGQIQAIPGGFLSQGRFRMGSAGTAVDFRDSNKSVLVANLKKVAAGFNEFEVINESSRVDWTNISITSLGTVAKGNFVATDNADINFTGCVFTDFGTVVFKSNSSTLNSTFRNCGLITQDGSVIDECLIDGTSDPAKSVLASNPANITNCSFIAGGTIRHAIEITTAGTYSFFGNTFSGFGSAGTTQAAIYNNSGGSVTLNISGGGDSSPTIRNGSGASTTLVASSALELTGLKNPSEVRVYNAGTTTAIAGDENVTSGVFSTSIDSATYPSVDISILSLGYQNMRLLAVNMATDRAIPIQQVLDRQYLNP